MSAPSRGEIWWAHFPTDPEGKNPRPVIIVSPNGRNHAERANTVLVIPLTTTMRPNAPLQMIFKSGETGLGADSTALADNISAIRKDWLRPPKATQRVISNSKICALAEMVRSAMGCI